MTTPLTFKIIGTASGQPRHISRAWIDKVTGKPRAGVRPDDSADDWKNCIRLAVRGRVPAVPIAGPVICHLTFLFHRPQYMHAAKYLPGLIPYTAKPDRDNLDKAVLDTLTELKFWRDDAQVFMGRLGKWYCAKDPAAADGIGRPGCMVTIEPVGDEHVYTAEYLAKRKVVA